MNWQSLKLSFCRALHLEAASAMATQLLMFCRHARRTQYAAHVYLRASTLGLAAQGLAQGLEGSGLAWVRVILSVRQTVELRRAACWDGGLDSE